MRLPDGVLDGFVRGSLARWGVPGAAVGVLADGAATTRAYGVADLATGAPLTAGMRLRVASLTKPFTAALALSLAGDGLLDLDEPVFVPLPSEGITPRQLLAHAGGLESELGDLARFGDGDDALPRAVAEMGGLGRLVEPGRWWSYGNAGYWIVGAMSAERLGTTFEDALRTRVLEPLGLEQTSWAEPDATGHVEVRPGTGRHEAAPAHPYPRARRPSGGLVSTAGDLLRFSAAHLDGDPPFRLSAPEVPTPRGAYALGWAVQTIAGAPVWSHDGSYGGFESRLAVLPEQGGAFTILTNGAAGAAVVREVGDVLLEAFGLPQEAPPTVDLDGGALEALSGRYAGPETEAVVACAGGRLVVETVATDLVTGERTGQPRVEARPIGTRLFAVVGGLWDGTRFDFLPESGPPEFIRIGSRLLPRA